MGASFGGSSKFEEEAKNFGRLLARSGVGLVYGGGNAGLMGVVADAVLAEGGYVIGVRPAGNLLTAEHEHKNLSQMIFTKTMHERKQTMVDLANFLVALPGGLGTLDELADAVVLSHLGTHRKPVFLLNTNSFWTPLLKFVETMAASKFLKEGRWAELVEVAESAEDLIRKLQREDEDIEAKTSFLQLQVATVTTLSDQVGACPFRVGLLPALAIGCVTSIIAALFGVHSRSVSSGRCVVDLFMVITVLAATSRMISVPDSHALSLALKQGASWSGLYLGISKWGDMIGNLICAFPLHFWPDFWQNSSRQAMMCGLAVMSAGSALCLVTLSQVGNEDSSKLATLLCASRAIIGVGNGMVTQLVIVLLSKLTPPSELPQEFQRAVFYVTVGTGLGPLAAAAGYSLNLCTTPNVPQFKTVGLIQLILLSSGLCMVILFYPAKISNEDVKIVAEVEGSGARRPMPCFRKMVILTGLILCALRSFVAGSVEVGTPLLLEDRFGWSIASTGLITGVAFLMGLPIRFVQSCLGGYYAGEVAWIRLLTISAALGTLLLLRAAGRLLPGGYSLVLGDMIIFPSIYLSEGLTQGLMMRFVPHGGSDSIFEASSIALIMDMLINAFLGLGAVGARSIIEAGGQWGQDFNAGVQLLCCLVFLVLFEVGMAPYINKNK